MQKIYRFFRAETGVWEDAQREKWCWIAVYDDGRVLKQFGDDGIFHQFKEIEQDKLHTFQMVCPDSLVVLTLLFNPSEMKLIHFYRNVVLNVATPQETKHRIYCFGYEKNIKGKTYKHISMIMPDNGLVVTDDPDKVQLAPLTN